MLTGILCLVGLWMRSKPPVVEKPKHVSMSVVATAYTDHDPGCHPSKKTRNKYGNHIPGVAVDPRVIPLRSFVSYNRGKTWVLADDTGGAIKGRRIDIRMASRRKAFEWGRRRITILLRKREQ